MYFKSNHKKPSSKNHLLDQRGFSVTDVLIYLCILIVFIGTVIIAGSKALERQRQKNAQSQVMDIISSFRSLHYGQQGTGTGDLTAMGMGAGLFTNDMITGNAVFNPWGGGVTLTGAGPSFLVTYAAVPKGACMDLITSHSAVAQNMGLESITVQGNAITAFPITPAAAHAACSAAENTLVWKLRMRG